MSEAEKIRKELIDKFYGIDIPFQFAKQCATIAEHYHKQQLENILKDIQETSCIDDVWDYCEQLLNK